MKSSIRSKLENLSDRLAEVGGLLADPEIIGDQDRFRALSKEYAEINPVVESFRAYLSNDEDMAAAREMTRDADPEMRELGQEELKRTEQRRQELESGLQILLLPKDPADERNLFLEIRAGTGGDEAASSSNPAPTGCSGFRRPSPRAGFTPPPAQWRSCRKSTRSSR